MESGFFDKNSVKFKDVEIEFDENDDILKCIKQIMIDNNTSKVEVQEFKGFVKDLTVNHIQGGTLKSTVYDTEKEVIKGQGEFKLDFANKKTLFGRIRIVYLENGKHFDGIMAKALAGKNLILKLRFAEYV